MATTLAQQTVDMLDWVENHGYVVESASTEGCVEFRARRRRGTAWVHVGRCDTGDGVHHAYQAALQMTQSVAAEIDRLESKKRQPAPVRRSPWAALFSRWTATKAEARHPRTA